MYFVSKRLEISIAHHLKTSYDKRCQHLHGHNAIVGTVVKRIKLYNELIANVI